MSEQVAVPQSLAQFGQTDEMCSSLIATWGWLCYDEQDDGIITDFCRRAIDRLIEQFKKKYRIQSLLCAFVDQLQDLEYAIHDTLNLTTLTAATGKQLDGIGEIVGLQRTSLDDEIYRADIINQINFNSASGTPEQIIKYIEVITQATSVVYSEVHPAKIQLDIIALPENIPVNFTQLIQSVTPAGVGIQVNVSEPGEDMFTYDAEGGDDLPDSEGFFEPTEVGSGGELAEGYV